MIICIYIWYNIYLLIYHFMVWLKKIRRKSKSTKRLVWLDFFVYRESVERSDHPKVQPLCLVNWIFHLILLMVQKSCTTKDDEEIRLFIGVLTESQVVVWDFWTINLKWNLKCLPWKGEKTHNPTHQLWSSMEVIGSMESWSLSSLISPSFMGFTYTTYLFIKGLKHPPASYPLGVEIYQFLGCITPNP